MTDVSALLRSSEYFNLHSRKTITRMAERMDNSSSEGSEAQIMKRSGDGLWFLKNLMLRRWGLLQDNLVLSAGLIT